MRLADVVRRSPPVARVGRLHLDCLEEVLGVRRVHEAVEVAQLRRGLFE